MEAAIALLRAAFDAEGTLVYNEPFDWYISTAPALGEAMLAAGRAEEAAAAFRTDLERYPENGWALAGLAASMASAAYGEVEPVRRRFRQMWAEADSPAPFGRSR